MSNHLTLRDFRAFLEARAKCYDKFFKESEAVGGWMSPAEIEGRTAESELLHDTRENYLAALVILDDFENLMAEA